MKIEKRITRCTRRINAVQRQVELLREEVDTYTDDNDNIRVLIANLNDRIDLIWRAIRHEFTTKEKP